MKRLLSLFNIFKKDSSPDQEWNLLLGHTVLATLYLESYDYPWVYCRYTIQDPLFHAVQALFSDEDAWDEEDSLIEEATKHVEGKRVHIQEVSKRKPPFETRIYLEDNQIRFKA